MKNEDFDFQSLAEGRDLLSPEEFETVSEAMRSDNACVQAVAKIIYGKDHDHTDKEIYNEVNNLLKTSL